MDDILVERLKGLGFSPQDLLTRDAPGGLSQPGVLSANRQCRLLRTADGWVALNLAREADRELIPALTGGQGDGWAGAEELAARLAATAFRERAVELQLPVAVLRESSPQEFAAPEVVRVPRRVVDMSALWAGPLCARLLARAGSEVVRIHSVGRPDPTPFASPRLDSTINASKRTIALDLRDAAGRDALYRLLEGSDLVLTSVRSSALVRLGLIPEKFPHLTWVAITAHGFVGPGAERVGFGDDCAVAGGLVRWEDGKPRFMGDALADPLTGLEAARRVLAGETGMVDVAMSRVAATYARLLE